MPLPHKSGRAYRTEKGRVIVTRNNPLQKKEQWAKRLPYITAFLISLAISLILMAVKGIAPFGDQSFLCMDLWGQYFPMYVQQAQSDSLPELMYSWNGALGYNNWAQAAYYCNSLFLVILMRFVPLGAMVSALNWFCVLKIALSAVSCLALLRYKLKTKSPLTVAGAVAYSICAYMLAYVSQFMWTDLLIYAPLVLIGLERLVWQKRPLMYTLLLALSIMTSFYIGFSLCVFLVLYFLWTALQHFRIVKNDEGKRRLVGGGAFGRSVGRFACFSLLGGLIAAAVILPVGMAVGNTLASDAAFPEKLKWYGSAVSYLQNLLPAQPLSLGYSGANIFTGFLVFLLLPVYLFNRKIRLSERIASVILTALLIVSMNCNLLDYVWHGFHFPNQLPGRWTFLFSLFAVLLCVSGAARREGLTLPRVIIGAGLGWAAAVAVSLGVTAKEAVEVDIGYWLLLAAGTVLLLIPCAVSALQRQRDKTAAKADAVETSIAETNIGKTDADKPDAVETDTVETAGIDTAIYEEDIDEMNIGGALADRKAVTKRADKKKKAALPLKKAGAVCMALLSLLWIGDSAWNFVAVSTLEEGGLPTAQESGYSKALIKQNTYGTQWKNGSDDFYRIEANSGFTFNPSMVGNYQGIGYYSSTMNGSVFELLRYLGNRVYAENVSSVYKLDSVVQNSLFGIRYYLDYNRSLGSVVPNAQLVAEQEECVVWENPTVLPVAYAVSEAVLDWTVSDEVRAIQNQNALLNAMCGQELNVYEKMETAAFSYENATLQESGSWNSNYFSRISSDNTPVVFHYTYTCTQDGPVYLEHNFRAGNITVTAPNVLCEITPGTEKFRYLGTFRAGETVSVDVTIEDISVGLCGLNLYRLNTDTWNKAYEQLSAQSLDVERFEQTSLSGTITMREPGLVFTSVPQDGGWEVYCDGKRMQTQLIADALVGVRLPAGTHTLELRYHVPGLMPGLAVSTAAVLVTVWLCCPRLRRRVGTLFRKNRAHTDNG